MSIVPAALRYARRAEGAKRTSGTTPMFLLVLDAAEQLIGGDSLMSTQCGMGNHIA